MRVFKRFKKCGDLVVLQEYEKGYSVGYNATDGLIKEIDQDGKNRYYYLDLETGEKIERLMGRQNAGTKSEEEQKKIRYRNYIKAKNTIKDIVNTNAYSWIDKQGRTIRPKFLTLTYEKDITDLKHANNDFTNFIKRLNRHIKKSDPNFIGVQYVAVPEIQGDRLEKYGVAVWHYHILFFNMPYVKWDILLSTWGLGGAYIEGFKDNGGNIVKMEYDDDRQCFTANGSMVHNIGAYITKTMQYMEKSLDDDRLVGRKCYFPSGKLKKPIVLPDINKNAKEIATLRKLLSKDNLVFCNIYENEHIGLCSYKEYNTKFKGLSTMDGMDNLVMRVVGENWGCNKE